MDILTARWVTKGNYVMHDGAWRRVITNQFAVQDRDLHNIYLAGNYVLTVSDSDRLVVAIPRDDQTPLFEAVDAPGEVQVTRASQEALACHPKRHLLGV